MTYREPFDGRLEHVPPLIADHAPRPGPGYWDWRCLVCAERVDDHAGWLGRWRWRRAQREGRRRWWVRRIRSGTWALVRGPRRPGRG